MNLTREKEWTLDCLIDETDLEELFNVIKKNKEDHEIRELIERLDEYIQD